MEKWREDLITNNMKLVYFCYEKLAKTPVVLRYKDDLIEEGVVGLCRAAKTYNEDSGTTFSSYAVCCIRNQMGMFIRRDKGKTEKTVSLDAPIKDATNEGSTDLYFADMMTYETDTDDKVLYKQLLGILKKKIKPKYYDIFVMWLNGVKQNEISKNTGYSQSYISRVIIKTKNYCKEHFKNQI